MTEMTENERLALFAAAVLGRMVAEDEIPDLPPAQRKMAIRAMDIAVAVNTEFNRRTDHVDPVNVKMDPDILKKSIPTPLKPKRASRRSSEKLSLRRLSRDGKVTIPGDDDVLGVLKHINWLTTTQVRDKINLKLENEPPSGSNNVECVLIKLCKQGRIRLDSTSRPRKWALPSLAKQNPNGSATVQEDKNPVKEPIESSIKKTKQKRSTYAPRKMKTFQPEEKGGTYGKKLQLAQSLGFKSVSHAIAELGAQGFKRKCNDLLPK